MLRLLRLKSRIIFSHCLYAMSTDFPPTFHILAAALHRQRPSGVRAKAAHCGRCRGRRGHSGPLLCLRRDEVAHSWDYRRNPSPAALPTSCSMARATVCEEHPGRAAARQRIPAACATSAWPSGNGAAVLPAWLERRVSAGFWWYRIDARGNKPGVAAAFSRRASSWLPCWHPRNATCRNRAEPLPQVVAS